MRTAPEIETRLLRWMTEHLRLSHGGRKRHPRQRLAALQAKIHELEWVLGPVRYEKVRKQMKDGCVAVLGADDWYG